MHTLSGKAIMEQIAVGHLCFYRRPQPQPQSRPFTQEGWRHETTRFHRARQESIAQLLSFYHQARQQVGETVASIFSIHAMLLEDSNYVETIRTLIQGQDLPAEEAVYVGDSDVDMLFAHSAGLLPVGAVWGYRGREELLDAGAALLAERPADLPGLILSAPDCRAGQ